jgi:hypothetical protein
MPSIHSPRTLATALCATLAIASCPAFAADAPESIVAKLQPAAGWTEPEPARVAVGTGLFELIDGGAELYHEFGFKRAASWSLETAERSSIQIELYEMTDAAAAYGVWSIMQTGTYTRGTLGQGSLRFGYYVTFWSGSYFASVTGARPDTATQAEVDRLAAQLAAQLPSDGTLPAWFDQLSSTGARERRYFRGKIGLSNIAAGPAADLVDGGEGLFAKYPDRQVLLFHFASEQEAARKLAEAKQNTSTKAGTDAAEHQIAISQAGTDLLVTTGAAAGK